MTNIPTAYVRFIARKCTQNHWIPYSASQRAGLANDILLGKILSNLIISVPPLHPDFFFQLYSLFSDPEDSLNEDEPTDHNTANNTPETTPFNYAMKNPNVIMILL